MTHSAAVPVHSFFFVTSYSICMPDRVISRSELDPYGLATQIVEKQIGYMLVLRPTCFEARII